VRRTFAQLIVVGSILGAAAACGVDSSTTFNGDGSVVVGLKFLFPKSLMNGSSGGSVSGFKPSDIAADNAKLQARYPGSKVVLVTEGDESGALVTVPFKTEKEAFAFLTQPSKLSPAASSSSKVGLNLSDTGGMFASATHTRSGRQDVYTFKTQPATQPSPSPGSQNVLTEDELAAIFTVTFALTVPQPITSADGALFSQDHRTAVWRLSWLHAQTLSATTGGQDTALTANVSPAQDLRLILAVGFLAIAIGFVGGIFLTWRGLLPRRQPAPAPSWPPSQPPETPQPQAETPPT
jgi:hypothetical protein